MGGRGKRPPLAHLGCERHIRDMKPARPRTTASHARRAVAPGAVLLDVVALGAVALSVVAFGSAVRYPAALPGMSQP
jgi:hypothetical protein